MQWLSCEKTWSAADHEHMVAYHKLQQCNVMIFRYDEYRNRLEVQNVAKSEQYVDWMVLLHTPERYEQGRRVCGHYDSVVLPYELIHTDDDIPLDVFNWFNCGQDVRFDDNVALDEFDSVHCYWMKQQRASTHLRHLIPHEFIESAIEMWGLRALEQAMHQRTRPFGTEDELANYMCAAVSID